MRGKSFAALAAIASVVVANGCVDPVTPPGTPTLDDPSVGAVVAVSVGGEHSCALTTAGDAWCWGSNELGQVGVAIDTILCSRTDRKIPCEPSPRLVGGGHKFQRIAAGGTHSCGLRLDGRIFCWGDNAHGQLGDPATTFAIAPQPALTASLFVDVVAGGNHTCGLRTDGVAVCWGANEMGQVGISSGGIGSAIPVNVSTNQRFASISAGERRSCGRTAAGSTYCWGSHWVGRSSTGVEVTRPQSQPAQVLSLAAAFSQLSVGGQSTCALTLAGEAWCWEANPTGALGNGTTVGSTLPRLVNSSLRFISISAGSVAACAVADSGEPYCWGLGEFGQLGVSWTTLRERCAGLPCALSPNKANGWRTYSTVSAGVGQHMCGLTLGGNVYCWGAGSMGQRGDGTKGSLWSPTRVPLP